MKNNLYVGNIIQRIDTNTKEDVEFVEDTENKLFIKKESALLYKTKTGAYVDLDEAKEKSKILKWNLRKANKIDTNGSDKTFGNDIMLMPGISLSETNDKQGLKSSGIFVDEDSLVPYTKLLKDEKETRMIK